MSFRTTSLLFGILLLILCGFGLMRELQRKRLDPGYVVPGLLKVKSDDIDAIEITRGGDRTAFKREGDAWLVQFAGSKDWHRADASKVSGIIEQVKGARKNDEADVSRRLAEWGLAKPSAQVTLRRKDEEWTMYLGNKSADKEKFTYVNSSDRPRDVIAVRTADLSDLLHDDPNAYRSRQLLDVPRGATVTGIDVKQTGERTSEIRLRGKDNRWAFEEPPYGPAEYEGSLDAKSPSGVRGLLTTIQGIGVASERDFEPAGKNPVEDDKAAVRVQLTWVTEKDGKEVPGKGTLLIGGKVESKDKDKGKEQFYARLAGDPGTVRVSAQDVNALLDLLKSPSNLRSRDVMQIDPALADLVRVSSGPKLASEVTLYRPGVDNWKVAAGELRRKANEAAITGPEGLLTTLQGKGKVREFFDITPPAGGKDDTKLAEAEAAKLDKELGFDDPQARVEIYLDGLADAKKDEKNAKKDDKKDEKKDDKDAKKDDKKDTKKEEPPKSADGPRAKEGAKPAVTLIFGKAGKDVVYLKRVTADGVTSRVSVPGSLLEKATPPEGALAYLDSNLSPFSSLDVVKLEIVRPDGTFVLEREKLKDKDKGKEKDKGKDKARDIDDEYGETWLLTQPKDFPGGPKADADEVRKALDALTLMSARRWVKKVGPKDDLSDLGLKSPTLTATVTLAKGPGDKEAPAPYVYQFGKDAPGDKVTAGVYAMIPSGTDLQGLVFVAPAEAARTLRDAEFRNRTVFALDPSKVKEVKVTYVTELETREPVFERKGNDWVLKSGLSGFSLDGARVNELVRMVSDLKAERYVSFKGAPDAKMNLGAKAPLKIELLVDDGKKGERHTLTVGALKEGEGYFAQSSDMPEVIFLVSQSRFSPVLGGVRFFSSKN